MSAGTAAQARGDLAEAMLPVAARLACLVHGDGGPEDIRQELDALTSRQTEALVVVLAGLVDPDRSVASSLGWLSVDEGGRPVTPVWDDRTPLRHLAEQDAPEDGEDVVDEVAVAAYLAGRPVAVTDKERLEAVRRGVAKGLSFAGFDVLHGLGDGATGRFVRRQRKLAAERGEPFPDDLANGALRAFSDQEVLDMRHRAANGATDLEIAMAYGVRREVARRIVCGLSHSWVGGPIRTPRKPGESKGSRAFVNDKPLPKAS
ncbi:hypothetical protein [Streptomyces sp.]|uniref:hypothetical protein n=1 Tax=Streptomyces sp. TaxID=1931 RepID=UPI002F40DC2C